MITHRVYDDRTNKTVFCGDFFECSAFMMGVYESDDAPHIWIEDIEQVPRKDVKE